MAERTLSVFVDESGIFQYPERMVEIMAAFTVFQQGADTFPDGGKKRGIIHFGFSSCVSRLFGSSS